jgi:hypothetical protein
MAGRSENDSGFIKCPQAVYERLLYFDYTFWGHKVHKVSLKTSEAL